MTETIKSADTKHDDIIHLPHHVSTVHPRMSIHDRAAQFSPFAALTGYDDAVKETARLTEDQIDLDESSKAVLDMKLQLLMEHMVNKPKVTIIYFKPDSKKAGGAYVSITDCVKKIDGYERAIIMAEGTRIPIEQVIEIRGEIFQQLI